MFCPTISVNEGTSSSISSTAWELIGHTSAGSVIFKRFGGGGLVTVACHLLPKTQLTLSSEQCVQMDRRGTCCVGSTKLHSTSSPNGTHQQQSQWDYECCDNAHFLLGGTQVKLKVVRV